MLREFKVTVLLVNKFACASWYSMDLQNYEFKTVIKSCEIFNACAAIDDQPTVHKESQQVPGIVPFRPFAPGKKAVFNVRIC